MIQLFTFFAILGACLQAHSYGGLTNGVLLSGHITTLNQQAETQTSGFTKSTLKVQIADIKIGQITENGWYFGALYHSQNQGNSNSTDRTQAPGLSFGYTLPEGLYFFGHALGFAEFKDNTNNIEYSEGIGFAADIGYLTDITTTLYVGFCYSYRQLEFKKRKPELSSFQNRKYSEQSPLLSIALLF